MVCSDVIKKLFEIDQESIHRIEYKNSKMPHYRLWLSKGLGICIRRLENRYWEGKLWKEKSEIKLA